MSMTNKDKMEIELLYREMFQQLFIYARSSLMDESLAEEAVQDTFRIACIKSDDLLSSKNPKGWLMSTLKNVIRNIRRSNTRLNSLFIRAFSIDDLPLASNDEQNLELYYMDLIGEEDYRLLEMVVVKRFTILEASKSLGISLEACKKRVQRAKKKLKNVIKEDY